MVRAVGSWAVDQPLDVTGASRALEDRRIVRYLASMMLTVLLAACSLGTASPTASGLQISITQAEAAARAAMPGTIALVSAKVGPIGGFGGSSAVPGDTVVWVLTVTGSYPLSCGPAPDPGASPRTCPSPAESATIFIDAETGAFVQAVTPALR